MVLWVMEMLLTPDQTSANTMITRDHRIFVGLVVSGGDAIPDSELRDDWTRTMSISVSESLRISIRPL